MNRKPFATRLCISLLFVGLGHGFLHAEERLISVSQMETIPLDVRYESFDKVWNTINEKHWDPNIGGLDWQAIRDEFRPRVEKAESASALDQLLNEMLARLKQSHTGVIPESSYKSISRAPMPESGKESHGPVEKVAKDANELPTTNLPGGDGAIGLELRVIDGRAVVWKIDQDFNAFKNGVQLGWALTKVDNVNVEEKLKAIAQVPVAGPTSMILQNLFVDKLCEGDIGASATYTWMDAQEQAVETKLEFQRAAGKRIVFGNMPEFRLRIDSEKVDNDIPLFRFNCFFDPTSVLGEFETLVEQNLDAPGLIIDLRGNVGGMGAMAMSIAGWVTKGERLSLGTMTTRVGKMLFTVFPRKSSFRGKVVVLVDEMSMSTTEILAGGLKDLALAQIIGRKTPGSALPSIVEKLPHGAGFQYPIADFQTYGGERLEGIGVTPHQETVLTREALLAGIDPDIEAAIQWIRKP